MRLDTGFAGGEWPCEIVPIRPIVANAFPNEAEAYAHDDLRPLDVRALHPARTLVEKLALLHDVASNFETGATLADRRCGRHYYDIYRLLDRPEVRSALDDRDQFERIVTEMDHISRAHYGSSTARPQDGYAASPAFQPQRGTELRAWLEARYADVEPLVAESQLPGFGPVLQRVEQYAGLRSAHTRARDERRPEERWSVATLTDEVDRLILEDDLHMQSSTDGLGITSQRAEPHVALTLDA